MTISHNPTTGRVLAKRGSQGHGEAGKRVDLNAKKLPPELPTKRKP